MIKTLFRIITISALFWVTYGQAADAPMEASWGQVNEVNVFPPAPAEDTVIRVSVDGEKTDSCHSMAVEEVKVEEKERILFDIGVEVREGGAPCSDVSLPFSLAETIDGLPAGDYSLEVRVDGETTGDAVEFSVSE